MHIDTLESLGAIMKSKTHNNSLFGSMANLTKPSIGAIGAIMEKDDEGEDDIVLSGGGGGTKNMESLNSCGLFDDLLCREVGFIMLQLVNGLKNIQAKGCEELPLSLSNVILCKEVENKDAQARLCVLQG